MLEPGDVFAGRHERVTVGSRDFDLSVVELGDLHVPSGRLGAVDPFVNLDRPLTTAIPAGSHPAYVTIADVSDALDGSHLREAYLSIRIAAGAAAKVEFVLPDGAQPLSDPDEFHGVPVDAGTVAFVDAGAVSSGMPEGNWYEDLFEPTDGGGWFAAMDDPAHLRDGCANIPLPLAEHGENVVLTHSGWGDGIYPVLKTYDSAGELLQVHIDLMVLLPEPDDLPAPESPTPPAAAKPSLLRRILGG